MKRLMMTGAAALVALVMTAFALPTHAQDYQCQAQWEQHCIMEGWGFGSIVRCALTDANPAFHDGKCYSHDDLTTRKVLKKAVGVGDDKVLPAGKFWFYPTNHNNWKRYPAYFDGMGGVYIQARCKTANMGTTMTWALHPHGSSFPGPSTVPTKTLPRAVTCR